MESLPSCFQLSPPGQGEWSRRAGGTEPRGEAVPASHPSAQPKTMLPVVGSALVCCQHRAPPLPRTWLHGGTLVQGAGTRQVCCRGGGSPYPQNRDPRLPEARPSTGQQEVGYHPKVTFPVGLSSWQPLPLPSALSWPWGAGPSARPSCVVVAELESSLGQQKPLRPRLAAVGMRCSEAWEPRGRGSVWFSTFKRDNRLQLVGLVM